MSSARHELAVVGGGIVGLATAFAAIRARPGAAVVVLEKEGSVAGHQSGRNSNVLHAGVYYKAGSDKARFCTAGRTSMIEFCRDHGISHEICGKVVVATTESELPRLADLEGRCRANGVDIERIGPDRLREIEPHARGVGALHVRSSGIADYTRVCEVLVDVLREAGVDIRLGCEVVSGHETSAALTLETSTGPVTAEKVVTCAGLHADRVARAVSGPDADGGMRIVPFRGEYFELAPSKSHLVRTLLYPVPDTRYPFLGVHLTRGINGRVHAGPNAVLGLAREGYSWRHRNRRDIVETLRYEGFRKMAREHWRSGLGEMVRSLSRTRFVRSVQQLVPEVGPADLTPAGSGVRAQAVRTDGSLVDDFAFLRVGRALHVLNAPSPAATASFEIGRSIVARLELE